jgi:CheY-like chemotaxis protein
MGGEIAVRSEVGVGTTFTVRLLLSEAMVEMQTGENARRINGFHGATRKILIVDDDVNHGEILDALLTSLGFEVALALTGADGLARMRSFAPHLAIVDISLPDMTGWDVAARLREDPSAPRILMVSANAHEYRTGGPGFTHDAFVTKPVDLAVLLERVRELLKISWEYEPDTDLPSERSAAASAAGSGAAPTFVAGSRHHIDDLYQLGLIGHVRGIQAKLREIESEDGGNAAATAQLATLVGRFEMRRYMKTIDSMRAHA